jgi:hypothetical protein
MSQLRLSTHLISPPRCSLLPLLQRLDGGFLKHQKFQRRDMGETLWFIDEFGLVLTVAVAAFAIYLWRRRHELNPPAISSEPKLYIRQIVHSE